MNTTEKPKNKRERAIERWFEVLKKRREGLKWRELEEHFKIDSGSLNRMARKAENIERQRNGMAPKMPRQGKRTRVYVICENKRFYCLDKVYWDGISRMECECGCEQFPIDSERGKELKELRSKCRTALAVGDTRSHDKPALCSKFADWVILDPIKTLLASSVFPISISAIALVTSAASWSYFSASHDALPVFIGRPRFPGCGSSPASIASHVAPSDTNAAHRA